MTKEEIYKIRTTSPQKQKIERIISLSEKLPKEEREEIVAIANQWSERDDFLRRSRTSVSRDRIELLNQLGLKNKEIDKLKNDQRIHTPTECEGENVLKEFKNLKILIWEINKTYEIEAYTAVGLLARKFIVNISHSLAKKYGKEIYSNDPIIVDGKEIFIKSNNEATFQNLIAWLYHNRYLTVKDREMLDKLRSGSNDITHEISVSENEKDARKYFLTIKGLVESNFNTKNIWLENEIEEPADSIDEGVSEILTDI